MEAEEKKFWQELLNKILQCEKVSGCLFGNSRMVFCPLPIREECEVLLFGKKLKDWSLDFFKLYEDSLLEIKKNSPSLPPKFSFQTEELCFFYLTILGMAALFSSPKINREKRPIFLSPLEKIRMEKLNQRKEDFTAELFERFKKFMERDSWKDWLEEINTAFEHLEPHESTRQEILLILLAVIDGLKNSLLPIEEHGQEDFEKLHLDLSQFLKKRERK